MDGEAVTVPQAHPASEEGLARAFQRHILVALARTAPSEDLEPLPSEFGAVVERVRGLVSRVDELERRAASGTVDDALRAERARQSSALIRAVVELDRTAERLAEASRDTVGKVATGESGSQEVIRGIHEVASAAEELSASISEIARQAEQSAMSAQAAKHEVLAAGEVVADLASAAEGVGGVVEVISDVARQTNLLALNAAIEAARAGEAGRGFGVVAAEVKQLADQTARSTREIAARIHAMRQATDRGVSAVEAIRVAMDEAEGFAATISSAIYEQEAVTRHIAENAEKSSAAARTVGEELAGIRERAAATEIAAEALGTSLQDLAELAHAVATHLRPGGTGGE